MIDYMTVYSLQEDMLNSFNITPNYILSDPFTMRSSSVAGL